MSSSLPFGRKNILITGGAGFIGSHLCDVLVKTANVICVDNFVTSSVKNIEHLLQHPSFEFLNHDVNLPLDLTKYPEVERFQVSVQGIQEVYHLACPISKRDFEQFRIMTLLTNSLGMKNALDVAVQYKAKFLLASSSVLYGPRQANHPPTQEVDPCNIDHLSPHGAYDEGKRFSEAMAFTYADVYKLEVKIARIFRAYGPRMKIQDGNLLPDMIQAALDGEEMRVPASEQSRINLCFVTDLVDGLIKHMNAALDVMVVNLGSDQEFTLSQIAEKMIHLCQSPARVRFEAASSSSFESSLPNISKAREILHWVPLVRSDDGLQKMIDYTRSHRQQLIAS